MALRRASFGHYPASFVGSQVPKAAEARNWYCDWMCGSASSVSLSQVASYRPLPLLRMEPLPCGYGEDPPPSGAKTRPCHSAAKGPGADAGMVQEMKSEQNRSRPRCWDGGIKAPIPYCFSHFHASSAVPTKTAAATVD